MPTEPKKPLIVISYAHADEPAEGEIKWLSFVTGYLRPAIKHGAVELWLDRLMPGGADWEPEIKQKLRACDIFILLVSRHSLSSDYVVDKEIALIRERQRKGEAVHFYPLVLTPTPKIALDLVRDKNLRPRDGKPLSSYKEYERWEQMNEAADEIAEIVAHAAHQASRRKQKQKPSLTPLQSESRKATSMEGESVDRWLVEQNQSVVFAIAARAAQRTLPLPGLASSRRSDVKAARQLADLMAVNFRVSALGHIVATYPRHSSRFGKAAAAARMAAFVAARAADSDDATFAAGRAAYAAARVADAAFRTTTAEVHDVTAIIRAAATALDFKAGTALWREVRSDADAVGRNGAAGLSEMPLWSGYAEPEWAKNAWAKIHMVLPEGEMWEVWFHWYNDRLRGASRGEGYELVFASVPQEEWDKGPAAANAWIKARLQKK